MLKRRKLNVASFTDAWIETFTPITGVLEVPSHLLQMRGLKLIADRLKRHLYQVASFTDAWIETTFCFVFVSRKLSHLLQMRGLKHNNPFYYD